MLSCSDIARLLTWFWEQLAMSFGDSTGLSICHIHSPGITLLGSLWVWFFIYFRLFTHQQNILSFFTICISASYHLPSVPWKGRFSQNLCVWLVCQYHRKARTLGPTKFCCGAPSLGSVLDQRVVPVPWGGSHRAQQRLLSQVTSLLLLQALVVPLKASRWVLYGITP